VRSLGRGDWLIAAGVAVIAMLSARLILFWLLGPSPERSTALVLLLAFPVLAIVIGLPLLVGLRSLRARLRD
jgi:hypothetical protein